jgi:hypothetical protein
MLYVLNSFKVYSIDEFRISLQDLNKRIYKNIIDKQRIGILDPWFQKRLAVYEIK